MQLLDSKSLLAKLMATENLTIEQKNVETAAFDVKNRVLVVPTLDKKISGNLYDLFMGHEVGHALYTPLEGMEKAREMKVNRSVLNVVEDCRIERKMKYKYPGLRNSFVKGYKELLDRDFFGTKGVDLNSLNFIDKVNMHTKGGVSLGIKFAGEERYLLAEVESAETYDECIEVTKKIVAYMKKQQEEQMANMPEFEEDEESDDNDGDGNFSNFDEWDESESEEDLEANATSDSDEEETSDETDESKKSYNAPQGGYNTDEDEFRSLTDAAYKSNESKLFDTENTKYLYLNVPKVDLNKAIFDYKDLWKKYKAWDDGGYGVDYDMYQKIRKENNKVTSYLVKEFEMRKNADQLKRASVAKTGELNLNKIFSYKFNEDIFKKVTVMPGGKSHGLVLFLDWSGSMRPHLENTIKQLLALVMFCKKVNIPYEVYAFRQADINDDERGYSKDFKLNELNISGFSLINLLSSRMSASDFSYAVSALCFMTKSHRYQPYWLQMGGTPLNEAIISAMEIIPEFQKKYKLQIVNTVFLTDGDGHSIREYYTYDELGNKVARTFTRHTDATRIVYTDQVTKKQEIADNNWNATAQTELFVKMLKSRTGCNVLGFYILSGRDFSRACYKFFPMLQSWQHNDMKIKFRKEKYTITTSGGFDEYYLLRSEAMDTDDGVELEVKSNATTRGLVSAFSKYAGNKLSSRVVLNRFIGMIS